MSGPSTRGPQPGLGAGRQTVVTPEAVALSFEVAGLGSRFIAILIDTAIQFGVLLVVALALGGISVGGQGSLILAIVLIFAVFWGYFPVFEGLWDGRTPGKRAQRIRVVQLDGRPVTWGPVLLRNLVRIVDFLPGLYAVGSVAILLSRRDQRLGDLAAGTMVVREETTALSPAPRAGPAELAGPGSMPPLPWGSVPEGFDARVVGDREYELIRSFLQRRSSLTPGARAALAGRIAESLRPRIGQAAASYDDESLLEAVMRSYRARFAPSADPDRSAPERPPASGMPDF